MDLNDAPGATDDAPGAARADTAPSYSGHNSGPARLIAWVRGWPPRVQDAASTTLIFVVQLIGLAAISEEVTGVQATRPVDLLAVGLVAAGTAPLLVRRRFPLTTLSICVAAFLVFAALDYDAGFLGYSLLLAVYSIVVYRGLMLGVIAGVVSFVALLFAFWIADVPTSPAARLIDLFVVAVGVMLGDATRNRMLHQRAEADRIAQLETERRLEAEAAVTAERTRIARELHDLVAHSMSVVAVQAGLGHHVIDRDPATAKAALATIERTSREALTEMRRMLGILRTRTDDDEAELREPQPGLDQVDGLVERARATGLDIRLHREPSLPDVTAGTALAVYRIVQEGVTNAIKHAGPAVVTVEVRRDDQTGELVVTIEDDGRGAAADRHLEDPGHDGMGLIGMRERAELVGGSVRTGPRAGGGFQVVARLPVASIEDLT